MTNHTKRWLFWIGIGIVFLLFLYLIRPILLPFVLGMGTAYLLDPAADRLERIGFSRMVATALITACFFLTFIMLSAILLPLIAEQMAGLISAIPDYIHEIKETYAPVLSRWMGEISTQRMDSFHSAATDVSGIVVSVIGGFAEGLFKSGMAIVNLLSLVLITPVVAFYLLRDWDSITARFDRLLPRPHADTIRTQLNLIDRTLAGFIRGQLMVCLVLGVYYMIALSLAGLHYAVLIGLITGLLVIVPYVGTVVSVGLSLAVAFFQFNSLPPIAVVVAIYVLGQILEGYFLTPKLVGDRVGLHPVWIIFGMLAGATLFGFVGVLIAIPVTAVIGVLIRFALTHYLQSDYYQGEPPPSKT